ncbi:MAG: hypothetical protein ACYTGW_16385 [Planctomycetota bacterium]|jgi:hypothetical protein
MPDAGRWILPFVLLLAGCSGEPVRALHVRPSFQGKITLEGDSLSLTRELVFDRRTRHCQLTCRGPRTVVLGRDRSGTLFAYEGGEPRPMRPVEARQLNAVLALVDGIDLTELRADPRGYWVELSVVGRVRVTLEDGKGSFHGERR